MGLSSTSVAALRISSQSNLLHTLFSGFAGSITKGLELESISPLLPYVYFVDVNINVTAVSKMVRVQSLIEDVKLIKESRTSFSNLAYLDDCIAIYLLSYCLCILAFCFLCSLIIVLMTAWLIQNYRKPCFHHRLQRNRKDFLMKIVNAYTLRQLHYDFCGQVNSCC